MSIDVASQKSHRKAVPPGSLGGLLKSTWVTIARSNIKEDQTATRVANDVGDMRVDVFSDGSGIDSGLSSSYVQRGTPNYDVIATTPGIPLFRPGDITSGLQGYWKMETAYNRTVTANGNAQIDTAQSVFGGASGLFDGTGDFLSLADSEDWHFNNGPFTIEARIRISTLAANSTIMSQATDSGNYWTFFVDTNGELRFQIFSGGSIALNIPSAPGTIAINTWYHVAVSKNKNRTYRMLLDGAVASSGGATVNIPNYTGSFFIGKTDGTGFGGNLDQTGPAAFNGWIDEVRISKGISRYNGSYTIPASAFTTDRYTALLLHMDGTDGSTTFTDSTGTTNGLGTDSSTNSNHLTNTGGVTGHYDNYWDLSEKSGEFEVNASQFLTITDAAQTGLDLTGSFTIAFWIKPETIALSFIIDKGGVNLTSGYAIRLFVDGKIGLTLNGASGGGNEATESVTSLVANKWHHVVVVYNGSFNQIYIDGNLDTSEANTSSPLANSNDFFIGDQVGATTFFDGLLKDVAIWNTALTSIQIKSLAFGVNLSSLAFRPNDGSLTAPSAYWKLNEISSGAGAITRNDSISTRHLTDNNTTAAGRGYVEAAGADFEADNLEYLDGGITAFWDLGSSNFTWAGWIYFESLGVNRGILGKQEDTTKFWNIKWETTNIIRFQARTAAGDGDAINMTWSFTPSTLTWYHWAITRSGSSWILYIDGKAVSTNSDATAVPSYGGSLFVGRARDSVAAADRYHDGSMSDLAFWNATALSAANIASLASGIPIQQQGLVSYYKLDESSGNATDSIGSNTLTQNGTGGIGTATGQVGNARDFESADSDYFSVGNSDELNLNIYKQLTVMCWSKHESIAANQAMIAKYHATNNTRQYQLTAIDDVTDHNEFQVSTDGVTPVTVVGTYSIPIGSFYHAAGVFDGNVAKLYNNSRPDTSASVGADLFIGGSNFVLGATNDGTAAFFDGLMDEVLVATRWFRDEEIKTAYNKGLNAKEITSSEVSAGGVATVISTALTLSESPTHALLVTNKTLSTGSITFYVSRVSSPGSNLADTTKWKQIIENEITDITSLNAGSSGRWAASVTNPAELDDVVIIFGKATG